MKGWHRFAFAIIGILCAGAVLLAFGLCWLAPSFDDLCGNTIVATEFSPDHRWKAVLFERDCGATTGFSSQVSVLPAQDDLPNKGGNVFAANEGRGGEPAAWGGPFVALSWLDARTLALRHDTLADVRFSATQVEDVTVVLKPFP